MDNKILLADDEEGIRKVLGISLTDSGYDVITAENGEEALEIFRRVQPSIVLTDIKMPGMDGIELLQKIKQEDPDTEVIMITGHGDLDLAIKSLKYEATDFVTKPINDDILEIALKRAHEKMDMRRQLRQYTENLEELVRKQSARLVDIERLAAVGQAVEGLSSAIRDIAGDLEGGIRYFNEMPCFVAIHNRDLKVVATNQLYKSRLGDKVGKRSWEIYKPKENDKYACPVARTFDSGQGQRSQEIINYLDGGRFSAMVHTAPIRDSRGDLELVLEISADISEVERLQEELRTTQKRYQQLFDLVPCYITVQDRDLKIMASNQLFKEDFGEDIGSHCYAVYKHQAQPCNECPVAKTFRDGNSHQSEMVVTAKSGDQYHVLISTAPILNAVGVVEHVMEMSTNITEIRLLQDRLSSLGLMVSSIAHGVKGILTGLDGGMYFLGSGLTENDPDKVEEGMDIVKQMVDRMRKMVLDILYYAKERALDWKQVPVLQFAEDVISIVTPKLQNHPIEFIREFDPTIDKFEVDAAVAATALTNIIENAIEACIEDRNTNSPQIIFAVKQDHKHIIFTIRDNGIGMDQETRDNIFNLFYSSKGQKGTGLGLFIARNIIQQHGGTIHVESTPGQGSSFRVMMPKVLPPAAKEESTILK
ncbi:MAG: response regulator [Desulfobacterales bacterium]|jgi:signal transduction histidine kinase/FixJ family two-component response regulator